MPLGMLAGLVISRLGRVLLPCERSRPTAQAWHHPAAQRSWPSNGKWSKIGSKSAVLDEIGQIMPISATLGLPNPFQRIAIRARRIVGTRKPEAHQA